jgi:DNA-directed RNA polymerase beta subunit
MPRRLLADFLELQRKSFFYLLESGLMEELARRNPIQPAQKEWEVVFHPQHYRLRMPNRTPERCIVQGKSYVSKLYVPVQWMHHGTKQKIIRWVLIGDLPLMTKRGHFIIRGAPRVVVNQLLRSPGVYYREKIREFYEDVWDEQPSQVMKRCYADIICLRGTWLRLEVEPNKEIWARTKRGPSIPAWWLLIGMGFTDRLLLRLLPSPTRWLFSAENSFEENAWLLLQKDATDKKDKKDAELPDMPLPALSIETEEAEETEETEEGEQKDLSLTSEEELMSSTFENPVRYPMEAWNKIGLRLQNLGYATPAASRRSSPTDELPPSSSLEKPETGEKETGSRLNTTELGKQWVFNQFMNPRSYDLGESGRRALNRQLGLSLPIHQTTLTGQDLLRVAQGLLEVEEGLRPLDDIDHLNRRRVRTAGELLQIQIGVGLLRLETQLLNQMKQNPPGFTQVNWQGAIRTKAFNGALREFFGTSPLSQFLDQINPLAELTHKRRLTAMGPGGITRDNATMEVRGIHPSHYGRICPIETPEGKNTGLVNSLTTYARVTPLGLLETPFYRVYQGQVQQAAGWFYLSATEEEQVTTAAGDVWVSPTGFLSTSTIPTRTAQEFKSLRRQQIDYVAVSATQMISLATTLIPFLEHDDANRALMGSNMQRQAVPLLRPERPWVKTGFEARAVSDSGHALQTRVSGMVRYVSAEKIEIVTTLSSLLQKRKVGFSADTIEKTDQTNLSSASTENSLAFSQMGKLKTLHRAAMV